tara:strand:+ start:1309 stop:1563 length:255 start_codon:yes stop_codon:yes gene_type:complete
MDSLKKQYPLLTEKEIKEFSIMNLKIIHDERIKSKAAEDFSIESKERCETLQKQLDKALKELQLLRNKKENERPKIIFNQEYLD